MKRLDPDREPLVWAKAICAYPPEDDDLAGIRNAAISLIVNILETCAPSPDRLVAVRKVREALLVAGAAAKLPWEDNSGD